MTILVKTNTLKDAHKANQRLRVATRNGRVTGEEINRWEAHTAPGVKHLAFAVLVLNAKNEFVLHKRPERKVGGGVFDTPVSHVLAGETKEQAMRRCLKEEYGFVPKKFAHFGGFSYEERYRDGTCENEYCLVSVVRHAGAFKPNPREVEGKLVFLKARDALREIKSKPKQYAVWFRLAVKLLAKNKRGKKFFE
ncbi:MAG: NUDIX domain-containing protein [Candidatus Norongarragalinales archaeon]